MHTVTTNSPDPVEPHRQQHTEQLRQRLTAAWTATQPWVQPPTDWLTAAATALATAPADPGPNAAPLDPANPSDPTNWPAVAEHLHQLQAQTLQQADAATSRRQQLIHLQAQVRQRAIDQLIESPDLEYPLRDALATWGLPPLGEDDEDFS